jgi:hypothetical protein
MMVTCTILHNMMVEDEWPNAEDTNF